MWPPATVVPAHTKVLVPYARATDKLTRTLTTSRLIGAAIGIPMSALKINQDEAFHQLRKASQKLNRDCPPLPTRSPPTGALPAAGRHEPPGCYTHARRDSGSVAGDPTAAC